MAESTVIAEVLIAVSALDGGMFWRNNSGAMPLPNGRMIRFGLPGSADIIGCYRSRAVAIECKTDPGRQSKSQFRFQFSWERAGGLYVLARSAEDAINAIAR